MKIGDTVRVKLLKCTGEIISNWGGGYLVQILAFTSPILCYPDELEVVESAPVKHGRKFRLLLLAIITLIIGVASYLIADGWRI